MAKRTSSLGAVSRAADIRALLERPAEWPRLEAVRALGVLDTLPEPIFDRLTAMAARACSCSQGVLVFVDETRVWPKASYGFVAQVVPRSEAPLTARTLASLDVVAERDVTESSEASQRVWADRFGIRGFAAVPLISESGHAVGFLGVFDRVPHEFSEAERQALRDYAALAMSALERRAGGPGEGKKARASASSPDTSLHLKHLEAAAKIGRTLLEGSPVSARMGPVLSLLGQSLGASRAQQHDVSGDGNSFSTKFALGWCATGVAAQGEAANAMHVAENWLRADFTRAAREGAKVTAPIQFAEGRDVAPGGDVRSILVCGYLVNGHPRGFLVLQDAREPRVWSAEECEHLSSVATGVALALANEDASLGLQALEERLARTLDAISDAVFVTDAKARMVLVNPAACALLGMPATKLTGERLGSFFTRVDPAGPPATETPDPIGRVLREGETVTESGGVWAVPEGRSPRLVAGPTAPLRDAAGRVTGAVRVFRDVTETERLRAERRRAEQFNALASFASGIGNDFNNALAAISGNLSLASMQLKDQPEAAAAGIEEAQRATQSARAVAALLLGFSPASDLDKKLVPLAELVHSITTEAFAQERATAQFELPDDLPPVELDPEVFGLVVRNLARNAAEAMPMGGRLRVWAEVRELSRDHPTGLAPGRYVKICFEDEGSGFAPELMEKIFQPFFTTKPGAGGFGLAFAYSIVRQHNGVINADSIVGQGSIFRVYLPLGGSGTTSVPPAAAVKPTRESLGRILVLDDDLPVRQVFERVLSQLGYESSIFPDGESLVAEFKERKEKGRRCDALILDLSIPGGPGGFEILQRVRKLDPKVCAIATSGFMDSLNRDDLERRGFSGVLPKPFTVNDVGTALEAALARRPAGNKA